MKTITLIKHRLESRECVVTVAIESESEVLIALANIRTELLNAVETIEAIAKNIEYKGGETE